MSLIGTPVYPTPNVIVTCPAVARGALQQRRAGALNAYFVLHSQAAQQQAGQEAARDISQVPAGSEASIAEAGSDASRRRP